MGRSMKTHCPNVYSQPFLSLLHLSPVHSRIPGSILLQLLQDFGLSALLCTSRLTWPTPQEWGWAQGGAEPAMPPCALCSSLTAEKGIPVQLSKAAPQLSALLGFHPFTAWRNKEGERRRKRHRCPNECTCYYYHGFIDSISSLTEKFKDNASIMLMCSSVVSIIRIVRLPEQIPFQWWIG